jgi:hypothetical protein
MANLVKTVNGLAYASIKTRNGLAVASIKSMNGVDVTGSSGPPTYYAANKVDNGSTVSLVLAAPLTSGYIVFWVMETQTGGGPWAATFDGNAMDVIDASGLLSSRYYKVFGYKAGNLASGTYSVVATGGLTNSACVAAAFNSVNQTTPTGTTVGTSGFNSSHSLSPTSTTSDLVLMCSGFAGGGTTLVSVGAGQTTRISADDAGSGNHVTLSTKAGATTTTSMTTTWSGSVNSLSYAFALKP